MSHEFKTTDIKGKPYVQVNERIKYFRSRPEYNGWSLESEVQLLNGSCFIKAIIKDQDGRIIATGCAHEKDGDSFINRTSYIENCETSAWGRALGNLGIGIDKSIATAEEVENAVKNQSKPKESFEHIDREIQKLIDEKGCPQNHLDWLIYSPQDKIKMFDYMEKYQPEKHNGTKK